MYVTVYQSLIVYSTEGGISTCTYIFLIYVLFCDNTGLLPKVLYEASEMIR